MNIKAFKESTAQHVRIIERKKAARRRFFVSACGVCIHGARRAFCCKVLLASNLHALHTQNIISLLFARSLSRKVRLSRTRMDKWSEICYLCAKNNKISKLLYAAAKSQHSFSRTHINEKCVCRWENFSRASTFGVH
jgi:hypothetical protein